MMRSFAVLLLLSSCLFSCKRDGLPSGILKPEKMQAVMWDMMRADVFTDNFIAKDSSKNSKTENIKLQQQVLLINRVTKEEYYNSLEYYKKNPALFGVMLDSLSTKVTREHEKTLKPVPDKITNKPTQ